MSDSASQGHPGAFAPATSSAPEVPAAVISMDPPLGSTDVDPVTPLRVNAGHGTLSAVTVTADDGTVLPGALDPGRASWTAAEDLDYATTHTVRASATDAAGRVTDAGGTVRTVIPRTLTMPTVLPDADTYGVDVGGGVHGQAGAHVEFDIGAKRVAEVDADELQLRLYVDDQLVRTMPTSLGNAANQTPSGTYVVMQQSRTYTMDSSTYGVPIDAPGGYRTPVDYVSRLSDSGIFGHAAPWSVGDQGRRNVSHGCLNVSTADAGWCYEHFGRGDVVRVTGAGSQLHATDGFGDWNTSWDEWVAGSALTPTTT